MEDKPFIDLGRFKEASEKFSHKLCMYLDALEGDGVGLNFSGGTVVEDARRNTELELWEWSFKR
jgi:hypothetical protein